ncbi:MAG: sodium:solute symporter [bacterium]|nr:sodium:solute symporter [bacterium]
MPFLDWCIVAASIIAVLGVAVWLRRYVKGVSGFLAADRSAGRYLLTLADGMAGLSAIGIIGVFQQQYHTGFGGGWWGAMLGPVGMAVTLMGFIIYRFRESRAMTMGQFFEMRYSKRFRIFSGILAWVAGVLNYGVFPAVTARFIIYFCNLPVYLVQLGPLQLDLTLGAVMAVLLGTALVATLLGGQVVVMVTDFLQAQFVNVVFLAILAMLFLYFGWSDIVTTLKQHAPKGASMLNPFDQSNMGDFSIWFFAIGAFNVVYTCMAWQGNQAFNCSARTPHDAKMARVLAVWRSGVTWSVIGLLPICAFVLMHAANCAPEAAATNAALNAIGDSTIQKQVLVPLALKQIMPTGLLGLFVAAMIACAISTDDAYLHSWGSILIQDVILPFRRTPFAPQQHMRLLRWSIVGVAVFAWVFGMLFKLREYIFMYWAITGAIYTGGAGAAIIGGFYWKRGTTAGAWAGMITGSVLGALGTLNNNLIWPWLVPVLQRHYPAVVGIQRLPVDFWFNGMQLFFFACVAAATVYIITSLLTKPHPDFSMDRILNRGAYAIAGEHAVVNKVKQSWFKKLLGIDEEYTRGDRLVAWSVFLISMYGFGTFVVGTLIGLLIKTTDDSWSWWWAFATAQGIVIGTVTLFWFLWCGFKDMGALLRRLAAIKEDASDDGTVRQANDE